MDLLLDEYGDIVFENGDFVITDSVAQEVKVRLRWMLGEWRYDISMGLNRFIGTKNPDLETINSIISGYLEEMDNVYMANINSELDNATRVLNVNFELQTSQGVVEGETDLNG